MIKLGYEVEFDGRMWVVTEFCEEPNAGLAVITPQPAFLSESSYALPKARTVPVALLWLVEQWKVSDGLHADEAERLRTEVSALTLQLKAKEESYRREERCHHKECERSVRLETELADARDELEEARAPNVAKGREAEELRQALAGICVDIEGALESTDTEELSEALIAVSDRIRRIEDEVDARDSLAYVEERALLRRCADLLGKLVTEDGAVLSRRPGDTVSDVFTGDNVPSFLRRLRAALAGRKE